MSRRPFIDPTLAAQDTTRWRRPRRASKSEQLIRRLLLAWLLLLGGVLLTQALPFPGSERLGYWLLVAVALGSPVVAVLLLWWVGLGLRDAYHRMRVLRRAAKWKRKEPSNDWLEEEWNKELW